MVMCFVPLCRHYSERKTCKYFRFPTNPEVKQKWIDLISRGDTEPTRHSVVCSCHFVNGERKNLPTIFWNRNVEPQRKFLFVTPEQSVQIPDDIKQEQFGFLETSITIKEEPLIYLKMEASLPENVCVAEGSIRVKEEPEDIKQEKDEDQITQNFESRVEGLDYNASDVEPGFIDVKKERDEDEEPQILESRMEDLDTHNPNATEEPVQIDPATDSRELDVVDLMFLDLARRFKQLSARTQIEVNSRLCQIITEAEVNEIKQRKQNL